VVCGDCLGDMHIVGKRYVCPPCEDAPEERRVKKVKPVKVKKRVIPFTGGGATATKWACGCLFECDC